MEQEDYGGVLTVPYSYKGLIAPTMHALHMHDVNFCANVNYRPVLIFLNESVHYTL